MDEKSRRQEAYKKYWEVAALELQGSMLQDRMFE